MALELEQVRGVLSNYCRALAGREVELATLRRLAEREIGWTDRGSATSDGVTIYLPSSVSQGDTPEESFGWYKVLATHQAGHIEYGSYDFDLERPGRVFSDLRSALVRGGRVASAGQEPGPGGLTPAAGTEAGGVAEQDPAVAVAADRGRLFSCFFALFEDQRLARDLFAIAEDARVDSRIEQSYPGLSPLLGAAQELSLRRRPPIVALPAREALVELLVRVSLRQTEGLVAPAEHLDTALRAACILGALSSPRAAVEDASEAAIRLYFLLIRVPNIQIKTSALAPVPISALSPAGELDGDGGEDGIDPPAVVVDLSPEPRERASGSYRPAAEVLYRGAFKPELAQLLASASGQGRAGAPGEKGVRRLSDQIESLVHESPEVELMTDEMPDEMKRRALKENLLQEMAERGPSLHHPSGSDEADSDDGEPLQAEGPESRVYEEWDCQDRAYKKSWCLVRESPAPGASTGFYQATLRRHSGLARRVRRQFEAIALQMFRKQKRLEDGEEYDLDAAVEAAIDLRAGKPPSEKLFWRRDKNERSVAAALLLDMSASTATAIGEKPGSPAEGKQRIIDLEKEALVLLMEALEVLGDGYGVYGFSGYSRRNVEFYVVKDLDEKLTRPLKRRIEGIEPRNATRMGAAIRHAAAKLMQYPASFRFLFLLSDGRPQDLGYSSTGESRRYAVEDTRMALLQARGQGITPFCLTVDRDGHDYLKNMMQGMGYEVLWDIAMLPERLPLLYRRLTT